MTRGREIEVPAGALTLRGSLAVPPDARAVVLFAHGAGSSRASPRNRFVACALGPAFATLLVDLLSPSEERIDAHTGYLRFDVPLLASRLVAAVDWLVADASTGPLPIGCYGSSTGAAAALIAAAERPAAIGAVVSRGGRPDLAAGALADVYAPTLLIVGGADLAVLPLNQAALFELSGERRLEIVPGATHLFQEPGALERVAELARGWFEQHLAPYGRPAERSPI